MACGTETSFASERAAPLTVLIVDDEDATRSLCREVVAESGLRTKLASTTEQALDILDQSPIEIVITTTASAGGGICFLYRLHSSTSRKQIPRFARDDNSDL